VREVNRAVKGLYKPLSALVSVLGGVLAGMLFNALWKRIAGDADVPSATERDRDWSEVITAAALQGALFGAVKAAVDRAGAKGFERVTGTWPGD
jgi:hypothetical protein